jgi:O-antigen ligase
MPSPDLLRIISVVAFVVFLAIGIKKPLWAVIGYMILVYCKVSSYFPAFAAMKAELIFGLLILLRVFASKNFTVKLSLDYNSVNKYLIFFVTCVFLSFLIAMDHRYSWDNAVYHFIKVLLLYVMLLGSIESKQDVKIFIWSFVVMFAYLAYEPTFGFLTGTGAEQQMYGDIYIADLGILSGHVALANNMNQMIPITFFMITAIRNKTSKTLAIIPLLIFFIALIGSASRGGIIGLIAFGATLVYFSKNRIRNAVVLGILAILVLGISGTLRSTGGRIDRHAVEGRLIGLIHGIEIIRLKGHILGVGPGCFPLARGKYFSYTMESHNIYGQVLGDLGIPGTIAWFFLILQIFRNLIESKKKLKALSMENDFLYKLSMGIQASLTVRLFVSFASHGLYYFYWYVMAALSIVILKTVESMAENVKEKECRP